MRGDLKLEQLVQDYMTEAERLVAAFKPGQTVSIPEATRKRFLAAVDQLMVRTAVTPTEGA